MRLFPALASALLVAISSAAFAAPLAAQTVWPDEGARTWTPRPTEAAITANDLRTRLYQYADDSMMGRELGTKGNMMATEYIAAEFKRLGLRPAGENGSYFQELDYGTLAFNTDAAQLSAGGAALELSEEWVPLTPNPGTQVVGSASFRAAGTVFGGVYGQSTLSAAAARGKVVVYTLPEVPPGSRGLPAGNYVAAQQAGAAGILLITPTLNSVSLRPRTGVMPTVQGNTGGAAISDATAAKLFGAPMGSLSVGATGPELSGSWKYTLTPPDYPARNVLAVLEGSDPARKGQYVIIGAHSDHVGMVRGEAPEHDSLRAFNTVMRPQGANDRVALNSVTPAQWGEINALIAKARAIRAPRVDSVMNGADDDGSGTVVMLEIAEQFARGTRPARSILFNSHAGEEKGLLGSAWWADHPTVPLDSVVAAHNMDMLGKGRVTDVKFGGPHTVQMLGSRRVSAEFGDMVDSLNAVRDEPMVIDYSWDRTNRLNRFCRSDQVSYIRKGIPTIYFSTGYSRDYHQATDEPQYINYDLTARVARFVHDVAQTAANRPERLRVLPIEEQDPAARCGG